MKKEDLYEVDWVKEQTKTALSSLQKEVLYTKKWDEVRFDVDTSLDYIKTLKDKKTYKEVMKENPWATIMAIQILLKNKWFNVGKIDWILKTQQKATSKTIEAIKEFQRQKWLTDDGAPGPDTIKKLLEVYGNWWWKTWWKEQVKGNDEKVKDLTKKEYDALCKKTSLTDEEVRQIVKYVNKNKECVVLTNFKNLTDKQTEELSKVKEYLTLDWLKNITDKQAESLSKVEFLTLDWLTRITDKQAESFWKMKWEYWQLVLHWLTSITDKQAEELSSFKWQLYLSWLTRITDKQAESLSKAGDLYLSWLKNITDKQATELVKVKYLTIDEKILTPKQKQILKKHL